ncbi:dimethylaniline monooxygenase [Plenodomus tracheiphilus IPT5]|uniref:Dimethylaniline monooxygenase n=1 Tax=Plenodomus tracheiphilus IPT5 TaxID=1408161 RepID=A0A6A7B8M4_9PLEO|nr:dimethylaniline monooxygenase [Plenodomus tracheiphilus IPT5]
MPSATRRVAVIGAGISGVVTAAHLKKENLDVTVYERSNAAGGIWWVLNTPCYVGLKNNVGTRLLQTTLNEFPKGTEDFVTHDVLKDYIQHTAIRTGVHNNTNYNTEVKRVVKNASSWTIEAVTLENDKSGKTSRTSSTTVRSVNVKTVRAITKSQEYDAVVVASGHYHAAKVPNTPGLSDWKVTWPDRVTHSKSYRKPQGYEGKNVLIIGGSVSSTDIARDLGPIAKNIYQSQRHGTFDLPASLLPENASRIDEVVSYNAPSSSTSPLTDPSAPIPATITLKSGQKLCDIHHVILATGYHLTLPFLSHLHSDTTPVDAADEHLLVTDGTQFHNLHKDIFYIPDPTLCFVGVPFFTATFTLFEFQAMVVAKVLSGQAKLPPAKAMRTEYNERVKEKGYGKAFHSLRDRECDYVEELLGWVNADLAEIGGEKLKGHTDVYHVAKAEQLERLKALFANPSEAHLKAYKHAIYFVRFVVSMFSTSISL